MNAPTSDQSGPPQDPRTSWDLPAVGDLPAVASLDELAVRVLAPNPSPMTLDGTNTYVIGPSGSGEAIIVDPGPPDGAHLERVRTTLRDRDAQPVTIMVTHHHLDHAEAAAAWSRTFGCHVAAATRDVAGSSGSIIADGSRLRVGGIDVEVIATPGHTRDHLSLRLPTGAVLTGDHVLGRGTSVVAHPDGDLAAYLSSLRRLLELGPDALFPGHGPELTEDPTAVLLYYQQHRAFREAQITAILAEGPATPAALVARIYAEVDPRVWGAAEASTRATLAVLVDRGELRWDEDGRAVLITQGAGSPP
ncbi:MAG: MBL fold metallo-hydrolase [Nitriliruptor sp.]|nr:MAG: MBL fold metallo-hydrolase [Nitriliruptor sp.]